MEKPHRKLVVWNRSVELAVEIYQITSYFPSEERFSLVSQMRRAGVSISSNLAEGAARGSVEFAQFVRISIGSVSELDTQMKIAYRLGYITTETFHQINNKLVAIDRMLIGLRKSLLSTQQTADNKR